MTEMLPVPHDRHGQRTVLSALQERVESDPLNSCISVPIDDQDLAKGYRDITYGQFENAVNYAAHWLNGQLPPSTGPFSSFANAGPKDLRYPILAVAAGKLGKVVCGVMILPSPLLTPEA
ncbi:MAG: hypothetical protein Q9191_001719 [Dirinaria sp. TL-2023a]